MVFVFYVVMKEVITCERKEVPVTILDCMVSSLVKRGRVRPRKTLKEIVKRNLMVNNFSKNLAFN